MQSCSKEFSWGNTEVQFLVCSVSSSWSKLKSCEFLWWKLVFTSKISKPAMSRMPMKDAPCRLVLSRALLMRWTSQRKRRSYVALARASTAKSAWRKKQSPQHQHLHLRTREAPDIDIGIRSTIIQHPPVLWSVLSARSLVRLWSVGWGWPSWTPWRSSPAGDTASVQLEQVTICNRSFHISSRTWCYINQRMKKVDSAPPHSR